MRIKLALLVYFLCLLKVNAQVEISGSFTQDTIVIGDEATFSLDLAANQDVEILGVTTYFLDSIYSVLETIKKNSVDESTETAIPMIGDFELIDSSGWNDANKDGIYSGDELNWEVTESGGKKIYSQKFKFQLWDPGAFVMVYPSVVYQQNGQQDVATNKGQVSVYVAPPEGTPIEQDSIKILPNKTINEEPIQLSDFTMLFVILGIVLLAGLIYLFFTKYYKPKEELSSTYEAPQIIIPPHEIALSKLQTLRGKELWQQGEIKAYQSELTYIIREYLEGRYDISALETTTDEIISQIVNKITNQGHVLALKEILQVADMVKFAKAKPSENIHESFMVKAEEFVVDTKDKFEPRLESAEEEE